MEKLIRNADELVKWMHSLYKLSKHNAIRYNTSGVIVSDDIIREFLCSENQGKITINGKTFSLLSTSIGYGCSAVSINDKELLADENSVRNAVDLEYALREVISYQLGKRSEKSLKQLADQLGCDK